MGVHDRDWWKEAHRKASHDDPKRFRRSPPRETQPPEHRSTNRPPATQRPESSSFALKVASIVLFFVVAVLACLHKSHLI